MVSEIRILRWCDVCAAADKQVEAEQLSLYPAGPKADLCVEHRKPFDEAAALLDQYGYRETATGVTPVKRSSSSSEPQKAGRRSQTQLSDPRAWVCPECLDPFSGTNGSSTLRNHLKAIHGVASGEYSFDELKQASADAKRRALARQRAS